MNQVLQSGPVTPLHLTAWVTDGVVGDAGVTFNNTLGLFRSDVLGINFNAANTDFPIPINLPVGYTRWRITNVFISGASGTLSTATCGVFTQAGGSGVVIVTNGAITIITNLADTVNNGQSLTINNQNSLFYSDTTIYFRIGTPQGNAATGNVTVTYVPLP